MSAKWYIDSYDNTYCTGCGERIPTTCSNHPVYAEYEELEIQPTKYCPHCGAYMDSVTDSLEEAFKRD